MNWIEQISRRAAVKSIAGGATAVVAASPVRHLDASAPKLGSDQDFRLAGAMNIVEEDHFGIINGLLSTGVNYLHVGCLGGLYAPPYASSNFRCELRLFGERIPTREYTWWPIEVREKGTIQDIEVSAEAVLAAGARAQILCVRLRNGSPLKRTVPVQLDVTGSLEYVKEWHFERPNTTKQATVAESQERRVIFSNHAGAIVLGSDTGGFEWEPWSSHWVAKLPLVPGETRTIHFVATVGDRATSEQMCSRILADPAEAVAGTRRAFAEQIKDLFSKVPALDAADQGLVAFYNRSLLHLLLNQWRVADFALNPYYSTGGIKGGCVGSYLWDYAGPFKLLPLYDPGAVRAHIKAFLRGDITKHNAINPVDGQVVGSWYPVNQEKIILSIYHYVVHTGDVAFLRDTVAGKTILDWVVYHATYKDDLGKPAALVDYGKGNNHLELRRQYRYDNYLPDLNGRRYNSYMLAWRLTGITGNRLDYLRERALALKPLLKSELWSPQHRWFYFRFDNGVKDLRYTVQMFKMINSGVLDREQQQGLISHLNTEEFLSDYGLHSMSKKDPAYDQVDIDNGGGGNYVAFTPRIAELLYEAGYAAEAADLLRRSLWWGWRVPYWSDSFVANQVEYRHDTPLQNAFDATVGAQCIIFGMFGVRVEPSGEIVVDPRPPGFSPEMRLTGLRIRGVAADISAGPDRYEVIWNGNSVTSQIGVPVRIPPQRLS